MKKIIYLILLFLPLICFSQDNHLLISQIQISGITSTDEYIKIYNPSYDDISLYGYKVVKKTTSGSQYNLVSNFNEDLVIKSKSYILIAHKDYTGYGVDVYYTNNSYSLSKDNSLYLVDKESNIVDLVGVGNCFEKEGDQCLENIGDGEIYVREDNIDTDNNMSDFKVINLSVSEEKPQPEQTVSYTNVYSTSTSSPIYYKNILISEIYPNPLDGEDEFIEIQNIGDTSVNLENYKIKDDSKRVFNISNIVLEKGQYYVFYKKNTGISLNNTGEEHVYFLTPDNEIIQDVLYLNPKKNNSYTYDLNSKNYVWSIKKTPGMENIIEIENVAPEVVCKIPNKVSFNIAFYIDCSDSYDENGDEMKFEISLGDGRVFDKSSFYVRYFNSGEYVISINIYDSKGMKGSEEYKISVSDNIDKIWFIDNQEEDKCVEIDKNDLQDYNTGDCVKFTSSVISLPNMLIDKCLYVEGAQIYFHKNDFEKMNIGDEVSIIGEVSSNRGEKRIKINKKEDISVISRKKFNEKYFEVYNEDDLNLNIAKLVLASGKLTSKTKNHLIIDNDDQKFDIYISNKIQGNLDNIKRGENISVVGIVNKVNDKFRILLRELGDVQKIVEDNNDFNMAMINSDEEISYGYAVNNVQNEKNEENYIIPVDNRKEIVFNVLVAFSVLTILIIISLLIKRKNSYKP